MISVIVPVYNGSTTIKECINSILESTYTDIEIIIVDDGSTDDTLCQCLPLSDNDDRIIIKQNPVNLGTSAAKNHGLKFANGDYITFVDSDDILLPTGLQALYKYKGYDLICGDFELVKHGKVESHSPVESISLNRPQLLATTYDYCMKPRGNHIFSTGWGILYKTSLIQQYNIIFDENVNRYEDFAFLLDCILFANNCRLISDVIYRYNTQDIYYGYTLVNYLTILDKIEKFLDKTNPPNKHHILLLCYQYFFRRHAHLYGDFK